MWRLRGGQLQPGYPALASRHWQGLPNPVDAAFEDAQGHIWFFQGEWDLDTVGRETVPCGTKGSAHSLGTAGSLLEVAALEI